MEKEEAIKERYSIFCPNCEWNLKGFSPHRFCSHCDYMEPELLAFKKRMMENND